MNKYIVVSYGTHQIQGMQDLTDSLVKYGWDYEIGGVGETWRGFVAKLQFVSNNIEKWKQMGYTHLIFVDAFDVLATDSVEYVDAKYKEYGSPAMLLAVETGCWPNNDLRDLHPNSGYPWNFYHSQYILDLNKADILEPQTYTATTDDQNHLMCLALKNKDIVADYECKVFMALAHLDERNKWFELRDGKMYNKVTNTAPCFWHGNGKTCMKMIKDLL